MTHCSSYRNSTFGNLADFASARAALLLLVLVLITTGGVG
jgi:hypothetical protein